MIVNIITVATVITLISIKIIVFIMAMTATAFAAIENISKLVLLRNSNRVADNHEPRYLPNDNLFHNP